MIEIQRMISCRLKRCIVIDEVQKSMLTLVFLVSFLAGIFVGYLINEGEFVKLASIIVVCVIMSGCFSFFLLSDREVLNLKLVIVFMIALFLGAGRFYWSMQIQENDVSNFTGKIELRGCIAEEVDVRNGGVKYTVEVLGIKKAGSSGAGDLDAGEFFNEDVGGRVLVTGQRYPVFEYGDCVLVTGKLEKPGKIEDFDYAGYLTRYDIHSVIYRAQIERVENNDGSWLFSGLLKFKNSFENKLGVIFAEPYASFMAGLILGSRRGISKDLVSDFNTTGLSHIVAISGYNITLLIVVVSGMFGFLSRKMKVLASFLFIFVFVILVGASAAVVRAAVMGVIGLLALWFGRTYFVGISLFSAAFFMNLWNPKILIYDVGFQLSFLATCGLVYVSPLLEKYFKRVPEFMGMRSSLLMTISAQVLALPVILLNFGRLSLISPLANIFVLPFIPLAMIFGFFAVGLGYVWNFLGLLFGFVGYLILSLVIFLVSVFAEIPFAAVNVEWFSWWMAVGYYCVLVWKLARSK